MLFDLDADPGERHDLSAVKPDLAKTLAGRLERRLREMGAMLPKPNPQFDPAKAAEAREKKGGKKDKSGGKPRRTDRKRSAGKPGR